MLFKLHTLLCLAILLVGVSAPKGLALNSSNASLGQYSENISTGSSLSDMQLRLLRNSVCTPNRNAQSPQQKEFPGTDARQNGVSPLVTIDPGRVKNSKMYSIMPPLPMSALPKWQASKEMEGEYYDANSYPTTGYPLTDSAAKIALKAFAADLAGKETEVSRVAPAAAAAQQSQATNAGNAAGESARDQAASAIGFCSSYLTNFTSSPGPWNMIRDQIFVPMALLLLLPGAALAQARAIIAAGSPVFGEVNPFDGILRSIVAIFLIPCTQLIISYGIDLSNSITYTINSEYFRHFGSDMYSDALCAEIRATPVRAPQSNRNNFDLPTATMAKGLLGTQGPFSQFEAMTMENSVQDPCSGINLAPPNLADEALPSGAVWSRMMMNGSNAGLATAWNILCAFQMAYLYYLWCVGPIMAALWVYPMRQLRQALPSWVEGVVTLCFWSLFWNTVILLMACFKGVDETGTVLMTALNFLATASVKYAFDFAGLVKAAGQEAANTAMQAAQHAAQGGGGCGTGGGAHKSSGAGGNQKSAGHSTGGNHFSAGESNGKMKSARGELLADASSGSGGSESSGGFGDNGGDGGKGESRKSSRFNWLFPLQNSDFGVLRNGENGLDKHPLPPLSNEPSDQLKKLAGNSYKAVYAISQYDADGRLVAEKPNEVHLFEGEESYSNHDYDIVTNMGSSAITSDAQANGVKREDVTDSAVMTDFTFGWETGDSTEPNQNKSIERPTGKINLGLEGKDHDHSHVSMFDSIIPTESRDTKKEAKGDLGIGLPPRNDGDIDGYVEAMKATKKAGNLDGSTSVWSFSKAMQQDQNETPLSTNTAINTAWNRDASDQSVFSYTATRQDGNYTSSYSYTQQDSDDTSSYSYAPQDSDDTSSYSYTPQDSDDTSSYSYTQQDSDDTSSYSYTQQDSDDTSSYSYAPQDGNYTSIYSIEQKCGNDTPTITYTAAGQDSDDQSLFSNMKDTDAFQKAISLDPSAIWQAPLSFAPGQNGSVNTPTIDPCISGSNDTFYPNASMHLFKSDDQSLINAGQSVVFGPLHAEQPLMVQNHSTGWQSNDYSPAATAFHSSASIDNTLCFNQSGSSTNIPNQTFDYDSSNRAVQFDQGGEYGSYLTPTEALQIQIADASIQTLVSNSNCESYERTADSGSFVHSTSYAANFAPTYEHPTGSGQVIAPQSYEATISGASGISDQQSPNYLTQDARVQSDSYSTNAADSYSTNAADSYPTYSAQSASEARYATYATGGAAADADWQVSYSVPPSTYEKHTDNYETQTFSYHCSSIAVNAWDARYSTLECVSGAACPTESTVFDAWFNGGGEPTQILDAARQPDRDVIEHSDLGIAIPMISKNTLTNIATPNNTPAKTPVEPPMVLSMKPDAQRSGANRLLAALGRAVLPQRSGSDSAVWSGNIGSAASPVNYRAQPDKTFNGDEPPPMLDGDGTDQRITGSLQSNMGTLRKGVRTHRVDFEEDATLKARLDAMLTGMAQSSR